MESKRFHHRRPIGLPISSPVRNVKGSILIWTTMLGLLLTSVFFMFSVRERAMVGAQRDTAVEQSTKAYLESVADYFKKKYQGHAPAGAETVTIDADGVKGQVTNGVGVIENSVDLGKTQSYLFSTPFFIEWNRCEDLLNGGQGGDLKINGVVYKRSTSTADCKEYNDVFGPITAANPVIETLNAPFGFRIKGVGGALLIDNQMHLQLTKELDYGKKITLDRIL
jgi:hypothetical protein